MSILEHKLKLGKARILEFDLAEITVDKDIILDLDMTNEYHDWVMNNLPDPCFVLINKKNAFEYTFDAQLIIGTIRQIKSVAFYTPTDTAYHVTQMLAQLPRKLDWNHKIFYSRDEALFWLKNQRQYN